MKKTTEFVIFIVVMMMLFSIFACSLFFMSAPGQKMLWDIANVFEVILWIFTAGFAVVVLGVPLYFIFREFRYRGVLYADERGLYPLVKENGRYVKLSSLEAEIVAAAVNAHTSNGLKLTKGGAAGIVGSLVADTSYRDAPQPEVPMLAATSSLPRMASVYDLPVAQQPALPIGVTDTGHLELPLHNLGNGLVGGLPGGGKSELLAAMMVGLMRYSPDGRQVQIAVIDTKRIDFGNIPGDIAPMWQPVAREVEDGKALVQMLAAEADRRFQVLEQHRARSLKRYNDLPDVEPLPYLVLFIDEIADWAGDKSFEQAAIAIGRKGRAAGITLVAATQRTGAKEISSSLRAVMGFGVAFRTRNNMDSRLIIGDSGAEGIARQDKGRCLVWTGEEMKMVQAYYAGIDEGRFDDFSASLPKRSALPYTPTSAFQHSNGVHSNSAVQTTVFHNDVQYALPPSRFDDSSDGVLAAQPNIITMDAALRVYRIYKGPGRRTLRQTQNILFPGQQAGGHWFYWIRDIVEQMEDKGRTKPTVSIIGIENRNKKSH